MPEVKNIPEVDIYPISDLKPLQRFTRETWKFHTFVYIKTVGLTHYYRSELTNFQYETTNKDLQVKILR